MLTTDEDLVVNTLTNSTYSDSAAYLGQHVGFGGELPIPEGAGSLDRFVRASALAAQEATLPEPDEVFGILTAVSQGDYSKWNIVYDLTEGRVHWRTLAMSKIKSVELSYFDLDCTSPVMLLDIDADLEGDVADAFEPYTLEANKALIEKTLGGMPGVNEVIIQIVAGYPHTQTCTLGEPPQEPAPDHPKGDVVSPEPDASLQEAAAPDVPAPPDLSALPDEAGEAVPREIGSEAVEPAPEKAGGNGCRADGARAPPGALLLLIGAALALFAFRGRIRGSRQG